MHFYFFLMRAGYFFFDAFIFFFDTCLPPPAGRAQSRPVGRGRQAQDQQGQRKKTMNWRILDSPMKTKLMLLIPCSKLF